MASASPTGPTRRAILLRKVMGTGLQLALMGELLWFTGGTRLALVAPLTLLTAWLADGLTAGERWPHLLARLLCLGYACLCVGIACWAFAFGALVAGGGLLISALVAVFGAHLLAELTEVKS